VRTHHDYAYDYDYDYDDHGKRFECISFHRGVDLTDRSRRDRL